MRATLEQIETGAPGLRVKLDRMRALVGGAVRDPDFRARVAALIHHLPEKDHDGEIRTIVDHVRGGIRYMRDPYDAGGLELFVEPQLMLADVDAGRASGDCDDHVLLAASMLGVAGYPTRFAVGGLPPDDYRHIWIDVLHPRRGWTPVELTAKRMPIGADPSPRFPLVERHAGYGVGTLGEDTMTAYLNLPDRAPRYYGATPSDMQRRSDVQRARIATLGRDLQNGLAEIRTKPRGGSPALPSSGYSREDGPTFVQVAQGFALPRGVPDQVAWADRGEGGRIKEWEWSRPLPGAGAGSYIPTPPASVFPDAPAFDPFEQRADRGGDQIIPRIGSPIMLPNSAHSMRAGTLGAEPSFFQNLLPTLAPFVQGLFPSVEPFVTPFLPPPPPAPPPPPKANPVPIPPTPAPRPTIIVQAPPPAAPAPAKGISPMMLAIGGLAALLLLSGGRGR